MLWRLPSPRRRVLVRDDRPWASDAPAAAFYRYSADRRGVHAEALLAGCRGFLPADGHPGFGKLYQPATPTNDPALVELGCWRHARRTFCDMHQATASPIPLDALQQIAVPFVTESRSRGERPACRVGRPAKTMPARFWTSYGHLVRPRYRGSRQNQFGASDPLHPVALGTADPPRRQCPAGDGE